MLKLSKIFITAAIALFFTITVINNISDYHQTFIFMNHTLSMDTTAQNPNFMWRAISNQMIQHLVFISIIVLQCIIALLCWFATYQMINHLKSLENAKFTHAKMFALLACSLGFILYGIGFLTIAGQWFMMRESTVWNVQNSVHAFMTFMGISLIYLCFPEEN